MKFLLPIGGVTDERFGIMTHPGHWGIYAGIKAGMPWAGDNQAFTGKFDPDEYERWLMKLLPYRATCLFIVVPDLVGDAAETLRLFYQWHNNPMYNGWPLAFVAQDGQEDFELPDTGLWSTLFVGGSTAWKLSQGAEDCIHRAQVLGKRVHIGRVNSRRRYEFFSSMEGSHEWTCDGTKPAFAGMRAVVDWARYMEAPHQPRLFISGGDSVG